MMHALVCALSGIGNSINALPLIQALGKLGYKIDVRISENRGTRVLFENHPNVDKVHDIAVTLPKYDIACCTHACQAFFQECGWGKKTYMIKPGRVNDFRPEFLSKRFEKHEVEYIFDLARELGYNGPVIKPILPVEKFEVELDEKTVLLGIGYLKGDLGKSWRKHWGNENFAEFAKLLIKNGYDPILIGGKSDSENTKEIIKLVGEGVRAFTDLSLPQTFYLMNKCRLCVTNETCLVPAAQRLCHCLSLVFKEAKHIPMKNYPYPSGVALFGPHDIITPKVVMTHLQRLEKGGPWTKVQPVCDSSTWIEITKDAKLACIRKGLGVGGPKVSIVILVCDLGSPKLVETSSICINKIRETAPEKAEIIIVANAPSPQLRRTIEIIEEKDSRVISISTNQNLGVIAKNFGYNLAQGEFIISIDGDVHVDSGWSEKLVRAINKDPKIGLVGPCGGKLRLDKWELGGWPCGEFADGGPRSFFGYEDYDYFGKQTASGKDGTLLDVIPSMCWCFRRKILEQVGYLDWRFGPFVGSDADFCLRLKKAGWKISMVRVPIHHVGGGGSSHHSFQGLDNLKKDHVRELFRRWSHYPALYELEKK